MKKTLTIFALFVMLTGLTFQLTSCEEKAPDKATAEALVSKLWEAFRTNDAETIAGFIDESFQSVHSMGATDMAGEIELLKALNIDEYTITDLKITTMEDDIVIATYMVSVAETIDGQRLNKEPAARMSVFVKDDNTWKWVAHANLKPLNAQEPVIQ